MKSETKRRTIFVKTKNENETQRCCYDNVNENYNENYNENLWCSISPRFS